jgi:hypothetical protein
MRRDQGPLMEVHARGTLRCHRWASVSRPAPVITRIEGSRSGQARVGAEVLGAVNGIATGKVGRRSDRPCDSSRELVLPGRVVRAVVELEAPGFNLRSSATGSAVSPTWRLSPESLALGRCVGQAVVQRSLF